jgi:hypothetical protein
MRLPYANKPSSRAPLAPSNRAIGWNHLAGERGTGSDFGGLQCGNIPLPGEYDFGENIKHGGIEIPPHEGCRASGSPKFPRRSGSASSVPFPSR